MAQDLYAVLGVASDASPEDLKRAYRERARVLHPDVGGDAAAFRALTEAWEVLGDPARRARYDRRNQPRSGPFYGSHWGGAGGGAPSRGTSPRDGIDLEDIFNDFGDIRPARAPRSPPRPPPTQARSTPHAPTNVRPEAESWGDIPRGRPVRPPEPSRADAGAAAPPDPTPHADREVPGGDVHVAADVPEDTATAGGTVTVLYRRLRRTDDGRTVARTEEIHDLRVPPGTRDGDVLRVPRMGHASLGVGGTGELVATVRVVKGAGSGRMRMPAREAPREPASREPASREPASREPASAGTSATRELPDEVVAVDVGVATALLGGHAEVPVADGRVTVVVPPCSSSGLRLRVRGRGRGGADVVAELRIVVPRALDEESRALIARFAALNPR